MSTWMLKLEYDGTRYAGWQEQQNARGVANAVREAAEEVFGGAVELMGAGRTDAGVHASGQVAHLRAPLSRLPAELLLLKLNEALPADVAALELLPAAKDFHARHDALARGYVYQIALRKSAFSKKYAWWIREPLDVAVMAEALAVFRGRHDFRHFSQADPAKPRESTIVEIRTAELEDDGALLLVRLRASYFLWRMVRRITGAVARAGRGDITPAQIAEILGSPQRPRFPLSEWTAPAAGLFLETVDYPPGRF
jgi:tRNA pseudouridine38-40 synthase